MPLPERVINPVNISRGTLQCPVPDELEGVTNGTLANIIRQLSSLSRHAEEMFGNLFKDAENIAHRSSNLQARIDRLAVRVTQLDSTVEEASLQDIKTRKAFRSSQAFDQQVVSRETMPKAMLDAYLACDKPPPLDKLNPYREDGKDGLKFYTDPNYFFELWKQEMLKGTEKMMHDKGKKHPGRIHVNGVGSNGAKNDRHKKRFRQPSNTAERQRLKAVNQGEYIMSPTSVNSDVMGMYNNGDEDQGDVIHDRPRPNSIEIKRTYNNGNNGKYNNANHLTEPIYMPRILRNEQYSPDGAYNRPDYRNDYGQYGDSNRAGLMVDQFQKQMEQQQQQQQQYGAYESSPQSGSPSKKRPSQPPPAPPPGGSTPTRAGSVPRDGGLPLPPPPLQQQLMQEVTSAVQNGLNNLESKMQKSTSSQNRANNGDDLPPPPPAPGLLEAKVPQSHLPPSPPPPPAPETTASPAKTVVSPTAAPPPPPPPPPPSDEADRAMNGNNNHREASPKKTFSPQKNSIISPPGLRKPAPLHKPPQDNVRSDLLKAIRDGIALKKVEQRAAAAHSGDETSSEGGAGQTDVASILARRVAVEMSDSDDGHSDSECDSDDWGDESMA